MIINKNILNINRKIIIAILVIVFFTISIIGYLFLINSKVALVNEIGNNYKTQAIYTMYSIDKQISELSNYLQTVSSNSLLIKKLNNEDVSSELNELYKQSSLTYDNNISILLVDLKGESVYRTNNKIQNYIEKEGNKSLNTHFSNSDWFKACTSKQIKKGIVFYDDPHFDYFNFDPAKDSIVIMHFATAVYDKDNNMKGVIVANIDFKAIIGRITKEKIEYNISNGIESYQIAIVNNDGLILDDNLKPQDALKFKLSKLQAVQEGLKNRNGFVIENNIRLGYEQINGFACSKLKNNLKSKAWVCMVRVKTDEAFKSIYNLEKFLIGLCLFIAFILVIITLLLYRSINELILVDKEKEKLEIINKHNNKLNNIIDTVLNGVIQVDENGKIIGWNSQAENIFGWKSEEIVGLELKDTIIPHNYREMHKKGFNRFLETGKGKVQNRVLELSALNKEGKEFPIELILSSYKNEDGYEFNAFVRDISDRKNAEMEIIHSKERAEESDRLKSAFLANISHEVRTPLNAIIGFSQLLCEDDLSQEEKIDYSRILRKRSNDILNIINDIIEISKIVADQRKVNITEASLDELFESIQSFIDVYVYEKPDVKFILKNDIQNDNIYFETDIEILKRVLTCFISNAFKFTEKGKIELKYVVTNEQTIVFSILDTGIGILEDKQKFIFERFRQAEETLNRNYEGTGLGLAISKGLIDLLGGTIWFESKVGVGSTFFFEVPCTPIC